MFEPIDPDLLCMGCMNSNPGQTTCPNCGWSKENPTRSHQMPPGTILGGEILIGCVLGEGGFGITYVGLDLNLNKKLAIKEYFPRTLAQRGADGESVSSSRRNDVQSFADGLAKFREEARTLAALGNERGIVSVLRYLDCNGTGYLVMPFVEGKTFRNFLDRQGGKIGIQDCLTILTPVMETLGRLHQVGLLHRDLSPDNIYLPVGGTAVLFDFGAARQATGQTGGDLSVIVKVGYAPEEQYRRDGHQGSWTDVYGLAATIYRAITGTTPVGALERLHSDGLASPTSLGAQICPAAEAVLLKALAVKADKRIRTMGELQSQLTSAVETTTPASAESQFARPSTISPSPPKQPLNGPNTAASNTPLPLVPEKLRVPLAIGLGATVFIGLLCTVTLVGLFALWKSSSSATATVTATASPSPSAVITTPSPSVAPPPPMSVSPTPSHDASKSGSGIDFVSKRGQFSVTIPRNSSAEEPIESESETPYGKLQTRGSTWTVNHSIYGVLWMDFPKAQVEATTPKEMLLQFAKGVEKEQKVVESEQTRVQGLPGICTKFSRSESDGVVMYGRSLYLVKGARIYMVMVVGENESFWNHEDAIHFLKTFTVLNS